MMKKEMSFSVVVVLAICLVYFAFFRVLPESCEISTQTGSLAACEDDSASQPVLFVPAGLVCAVFSVMAISPLLVDDPIHSIKEVKRVEGQSSSSCTNSR
jgi:hypothetical protein